MRIKTKLSFISVLVIMLWSCSLSGPLRLQDRTLLIDPLSASLIYPYNGEECKYPKRRLFKRCKDKRIIIKYDLNDENVRKMLNAAGFQCVGPNRFTY